MYAGGSVWLMGRTSATLTLNMPTYCAGSGPCRQAKRHLQACRKQHDGHGARRIAGIGRPGGPAELPHPVAVVPIDAVDRGIVQQVRQGASSGVRTCSWRIP